MPIMVGAALLAGFAAGGFTLAGFSFLAFAGSLVMSGLSMALAKKPESSATFSQSGRLVTVRQSISPWRVVYGQDRIGGVVTYKQVTDSNQNYQLVLTMTGHVCEEMGQLYIFDQPVDIGTSGADTDYVTSLPYYGVVYCKRSTGAEAGQPFADLVAGSGGLWTDAHRQTGRGKIYLRLSRNNDVFPQGVPNFTIIVKGRLVYDPRSTLTAWSNNPALCLADYLCNTDFGLKADYATEIDEDALIAAANICDELVTLASGAQEKRYTCNGSFQTSETPQAIITRILSSMAGKATMIGNKWRISAGAYTAPTVTLDEGDLCGPIRVQSLVSRRESANGVKGIFVDPLNGWQPTDFPALGSSTYLAEDDNERVWKDIDLTSFVRSGTQAQRLAKIELLRGRQGLTVNLVCKLTAYRVQPGDFVAVTNTKFGWSAKPFEVTQGRFSVDGEGRLVWEISLRETVAAIFDWATSEEQTVDISPNTDLSDPFNVPEPVNVTLTSGTDELLTLGDGTVISRIKVSWDAFVDALVTESGHILTQYKKSADADWIDAPVADGTAIALWLSPVEDGISYDVRVRAQNSIGVRSDWVQPAAHIVVGKTELPDDVVLFTIEGTRLSWSLVAGNDIAGYRIRYQPGSNFSWGDAIALHTGLLTSSPFDMVIVPAGQNTIMIKAVDTSGNESMNPAVILTQLGDPIVSNIVELLDIRAAGFPGTKTNATVVGGDLVADVLSSSLMWKVNPAVNLWSGNSSTLMWNSVMYKDMTYVDTFVVTAALAGSRLIIDRTILGESYFIEYRENSAKLLWSLSDVDLMWNANSATLMWDAPAWLPWPGEIIVQNSVYDFRFSVSQSTTQGQITALTLTVDAPDVVELINDAIISSSGTRLVLTEEFHVIKNIQLTVQNDGGAAITARTEDKDVDLGPLVVALDAAGNAVNGLLDARVQGY